MVNPNEANLTLKGRRGCRHVKKLNFRPLSPGPFTIRARFDENSFSESTARGGGS